MSIVTSPDKNSKRHASSSLNYILVEYTIKCNYRLFFFVTRSLLKSIGSIKFPKFIFKVKNHLYFYNQFFTVLSSFEFFLFLSFVISMSISSNILKIKTLLIIKVILLHQWQFVQRHITRIWRKHSYKTYMYIFTLFMNITH